jgi:hypothetical protein
MEQACWSLRSYTRLAVFKRLPGVWRSQSDDCENTTTLYVAAGEGKEFRSVYKKNGGGNGIRIIGWSPDGDQLLVEVTSWAYETDTGFEYSPVIYDAATSAAQEDSAMENALVGHLGKECSFEHNLIRWKTNRQVLVRISPYQDVDGSDEYSCVKQPKLLLYDLQTNSLIPIPPHPSKSNRYGSVDEDRCRISSLP